MIKNMVSIIVPVYNASTYIKKTIDCILAQDYNEIEIILIDDMSTDNSVQIIKKLQKDNNKIVLIENKEKQYAANARNLGIKKAKGQYIAYLDADDFWLSNKLKKQLEFMKKNNCAFSFTGYEFADKDCNPIGKKVYIPNKMTYKDAIKNTTIFTSTVMFDLTKITKEEIYMPLISSEDTACWWKILKKGYTAYGLNEILTYYRRGGTTLSSNKLTAIKRIWNLYRKQEKLNIISSSYYFIYWAYNAVRRRV